MMKPDTPARWLGFFVARKKVLARRCKLLYTGFMKVDDLQAIVDVVGEAEVSKALDWSRWTLKQKLRGKSAITKAEGFLLQALAVVKDAKETTGRTIR